jgi:restriction system protein
MSFLAGSADLQCDACRSVLRIDASDIDFEAYDTQERAMGPETFYVGAINFECPKCRRIMQVTYEVSEYPLGVMNDGEVRILGGHLTHGFEDINLSLQEKLYSMDEDGPLELPEQRRIITDLSSGVVKLIHELSQNRELLFQISSRDFEEVIARIFAEHGFSVELTKRTRDGGRDLIAIRSDLEITSKYIVECKHYAPNNPVGVGLVRALYGTQMQEGANKSVLATTSRFTPDARTFAGATNTTLWQMTLKDARDVYAWIDATAARTSPRKLP